MVKLYRTGLSNANIVVDRGRKFKNDQVQEMLEEYGVKCHPGSHGSIERFHSPLSERINSVRVAKVIDDNKAIPPAVLTYNSYLHFDESYHLSKRKNVKK